MHLARELSPKLIIPPCVRPSVRPPPRRSSKPMLLHHTIWNFRKSLMYFTVLSWRRPQNTWATVHLCNSPGSSLQQSQVARAQHLARHGLAGCPAGLIFLTIFWAAGHLRSRPTWSQPGRHSGDALEAAQEAVYYTLVSLFREPGHTCLLFSRLSLEGWAQRGLLLCASVCLSVPCDRLPLLGEARDLWFCSILSEISKNHKFNLTILSLRMVLILMRRDFHSHRMTSSHLILRHRHIATGKRKLSFCLSAKCVQIVIFLSFAIPHHLKPFWCGSLWFWYPEFIETTQGLHLICITHQLDHFPIIDVQTEFFGNVTGLWFKLRIVKS